MRTVLQSPPPDVVPGDTGPKSDIQIGHQMSAAGNPSMMSRDQGGGTRLTFPGRGRVVLPCDIFNDAFDVIYLLTPSSPCGQTDTCENITFPEQLVA